MFSFKKFLSENLRWENNSDSFVATTTIVKNKIEYLCRFDLSPNGDETFLLFNSVVPYNAHNKSTEENLKDIKTEFSQLFTEFLDKVFEKIFKVYQKIKIEVVTQNRGPVPQTISSILTRNKFAKVVKRGQYFYATLSELGRKIVFGDVDWRPNEMTPEDYYA